MSGSTDKKIESLEGQCLGRFAPVNASGRPPVVPVGFRHNAGLGAIDEGGHNTGRVGFMVDDALPPWRTRGVEARGRAEVSGEGGGGVGPGFGDGSIRIVPGRIVGWGIDSDALSPDARSVAR